VTPLAILPEMLDAGVEAYLECKHRKLGPEDTAISVYLAMEAIKQIALMRRRAEETIH
jgi:hypothetical protein